MALKQLSLTLSALIPTSFGSGLPPGSAGESSSACESPNSEFSYGEGSVTLLAPSAALPTAEP